jgi:hypothetical protein
MAPDATPSRDRKPCARAARLVDEAIAAQRGVDHGDVPAGPRQLQCGGQAGIAAADDGEFSCDPNVPGTTCKAARQGRPGRDLVPASFCLRLAQLLR